MKIGELASKAGVNIETIRYYERRGIIPEPLRTPSGYRSYSDDTLLRIQFIKRAKELGFSLLEISELLSLKADPEVSCSEIRERAVAKVADIEGRIETLVRMKAALMQLTVDCRGRGPVSECPILGALEKREGGESYDRKEKD